MGEHCDVEDVPGRPHTRGLLCWAVSVRPSLPPNTPVLPSKRLPKKHASRSVWLVTSCDVVAITPPAPSRPRRETLTCRPYLLACAAMHPDTTWSSAVVAASPLLQPGASPNTP